VAASGSGRQVAAGIGKLWVAAGSQDTRISLVVAARPSARPVSPAPDRHPRRTQKETHMAKKKIVCIGGGSLYFPGAIGDLVVREDLTGSEIVLYDLVPAKAQRVAAVGERLAGEAGTGFTVRAAADQADAMDGADFAISSIGGSGGEAAVSVYGTYHHKADMHIAAKYWLCQVIGDTAARPA